MIISEAETAPHMVRCCAPIIAYFCLCDLLSNGKQKQNDSTTTTTIEMKGTRDRDENKKEIHKNRMLICHDRLDTQANSKQQLNSE